MNQVKDLCIGNKVYLATINTIINRTVESISLNRSDENILNVKLKNDSSSYRGNKNNNSIISDYEEEYFVDYKKALGKQTELRKIHYLYLLNKVEEAQKALSEFILEYSILK